MSFNPFAPAHKLAAAIRQQKIGSLELLNAYLKRIERFNPTLNAIVVLDIERAKKQARAADRMTLRGESSGPLHGIPMTIKESFDISGLPSTGTMGLGRSLVKGRTLVPCPAARIIPFAIFVSSLHTLLVISFQTTKDPVAPLLRHGHCQIL